MRYAGEDEEREAEGEEEVFFHWEYCGNLTMKLLMHFFESAIREMRVDLRGGDAGVAEHFLD